MKTQYAVGVTTDAIEWSYLPYDGSAALLDKSIGWHRLSEFHSYRQGMPHDACV